MSRLLEASKGYTAKHSSSFPNGKKRIYIYGDYLHWPLTRDKIAQSFRYVGETAARYRAVTHLHFAKTILDHGHKPAARFYPKTGKLIKQESLHWHQTIVEMHKKGHKLWFIELDLMDAKEAEDLEAIIIEGANMNDRPECGNEQSGTYHRSRDDLMERYESFLDDFWKRYENLFPRLTPFDLSNASMSEPGDNWKYRIKLQNHRIGIINIFDEINHMGSKFQNSVRFDLGLPVEGVHRRNGFYRCSKCPWKRQQNTQDHWIRHGFNGPYKCDKCDWSHDLKYLLKSHLEEHKVAEEEKEAEFAKEERNSFEENSKMVSDLMTESPNAFFGFPPLPKGKSRVNWPGQGTPSTSMKRSHDESTDEHSAKRIKFESC